VQALIAGLIERALKAHSHTRKLRNANRRLIHVPGMGVWCVE
jgi:hypothetical protein